MGLIAKYRAKKRRAGLAGVLYVATVEQSRSPGFYTDLGAPDSVDGRLDMIILHVMLLIRRLRGEGEEAAAISQEVLNLMFADMDRNFREMGIGDMSVGKHVKKVAKAFYGRAEILENGLDAGPGELSQSIIGTLYRSVDNAEAKAGAVAGYVIAADRTLQQQPIEKLFGGHIDFSAALIQYPVT